MKFTMKTTAFLFSSLFIAMLQLQHQAFSQKKQVNKVVRFQTSAHTEQCKEKIEKTFAYEKGIIRSELDRETQILTVTYNPKKTNEEKMIKVISDLGHEATEIKDFNGGREGIIEGPGKE